MPVTVADLIARLRLDTQDFSQGLETSGQKFHNFGSKLSHVGRELFKLSAPLTAVGLAAGVAANTIDSALDRIRAGTGVTGRALDELGRDFRVVFLGAPQSAAEVSRAITELNVRLGLTGEPLQKLSAQLLGLARLTETDVNTTVRLSVQLFEAFGISATDQAGALDFLFKITQKTGAQFGELAGELVGLGPIFRAAGIGFEEGAAILGQFEKAGLRAGQAGFALRSAMDKLSESGELARLGVNNLKDGLAAIFGQIKAAGNEAQATALAFEFFGARGLSLGEAIRRGSLDVSEFIRMLKASPETIEAADKATRSFSEQFGLLKNRVTLALEPIGKQLLDIFERKLFPLITTALERLESLGRAFGKLPEPIQEAALVIARFAAAAGPIALAVIAFGKLSAVLSGPGGIVVLIGAGLVGAVLAAEGVLGNWAQEIANVVLEFTHLKPLLEFFGILKKPAPQVPPPEPFMGIKPFPKVAAPPGGDVTVVSKEIRQAMDELQAKLREVGLPDFQREVTQLTEKFKDAPDAVKQWAQAISEAVVLSKRFEEAQEDVAKALFDADKAMVEGKSGIDALGMSLSREHEEVALEIKSWEGVTAALDQLPLRTTTRLIDDAAEKQRQLSDELRNTTSSWSLEGFAIQTLGRRLDDLTEEEGAELLVLRNLQQENVRLSALIDRRKRAHEEMAARARELELQGISTTRARGVAETEASIKLVQDRTKALTDVATLSERFHLARVENLRAEARDTSNFLGFFAASFQLAALQAGTVWDSIGKFSTDTFSSMQRGLSDFFFNAFEGTFKLADFWQAMLGSMKRAVADFLASAVIQQLLQFFGGAFGITAGGGGGVGMGGGAGGGIGGLAQQAGLSIGTSLGTKALGQALGLTGGATAGAGTGALFAQAIAAGFSAQDAATIAMLYGADVAAVQAGAAGSAGFFASLFGGGGAAAAGAEAGGAAAGGAAAGGAAAGLAGLAGPAAFVAAPLIIGPIVHWLAGGFDRHQGPTPEMELAGLIQNFRDGLAKAFQVVEMAGSAGLPGMVPRDILLAAQDQQAEIVADLVASRQSLENITIFLQTFFGPAAQLGLLPQAPSEPFLDIGSASAQTGFHGLVTRPTMFLAGEAGPETVDVEPGGRDGDGSMMPTTLVVKLILDGREVGEAVLRDFNRRALARERSLPAELTFTRHRS